MFQIGQKIGPYFLERALGEGSYGVVWLAEERTGLIQRQVALKLPKDADPDIETMRREAATWLRAGKHQNIVQVLHADIYEGQVAIASEYVPGGSLHDWLQRQDGKLAGIEPATAMMSGILAGLQHLHSLTPKSLVHRDLKPGNVLLKDGVPLLTDFGLTRVFSTTAFTQVGGTPAYMPPEAFDDRFSPQTDIWAAGVTFYRMLKGELPFPHRDFTALIGAIMNKEPEPLPATIPGPIAAVITKALMKDPDRRFSSAEEMRVALERAVSLGSPIVSVPGLPTLTGTRVITRSDFPPYDIPMSPPGPLPGYAPRTSALAMPQRSPLAHSEALTAVPEPVARAQGLSERADALLLHLSRNTTTFCAMLLASVPVWGAAYGIGRVLSYLKVEEGIGASFLLSGVISLVFARLAWHRYFWKSAKERRRTAIMYAILGLMSFPMIPVVAVAFYIAISSATSAPPISPERERVNREIEPPPADKR